MTLRRYAPIKPSRGTQISSSLRAEVRAADGGCVGPRVGMPGECGGSIELDHVRGSGGIGMKSPTVRGNLVSLCSGFFGLGHHHMKTNAGRTWRPRLLEYVAERDGAGGMSDTNPRLTQFALDWDRLAAEFLRDIEHEMEEAFKAKDEQRYRRAALLAGKIKAARSVMLQTVSMPVSD